MELYLHVKNQNKSLSHLWDTQKNISTHFEHAGACLAKPIENMTINFQLLCTFTYLRKIKTIALVIIEILKIWYFHMFGACPGVPGHTHPKYGNYFTPLMELHLLAKKQNNSFSHYWDIENLLFPYALGMPGCAWPHPSKIWQLIYTSHGTLPACKKSKQ